MSEDQVVFVVPTGEESGQKSTASGVKTVVEEETVKRKVVKTCYEDIRISELISKVDILLQEVEDVISAIRDTPIQGTDLNGLRSIIREEIEDAISEREELITEDLIELREIPREQAKQEIMDLLDKSDQLSYCDIADALCLDLELVVELLTELESECLVEGN